MTYAPTAISGPIIPQSNGSATALPGITQSAFFGGAGVTSSGKSRELYTRTPYGATNLSGITADYASQIFLNNEFLSTGTNIISGFIPNYYIDVYNNVKPTFTGVTGSVYLPSSGPGIQKGRFEIFTISYQTSKFLVNLSGTIGDALSGLNITHDIVAGGQTLTAEHIYYRKIGNVT